MELQGKKILVGVCGSIAAYKAAHLVRLLIKEGAEVRVLLTRDAHAFVTPLTLGTLSKNPVLTDFTGADASQWNSHVELGLWADCLLIAPISANTLAKCAHGLCDNLLTATYLSARCPVIIAPAMDLDMYQHPTVQENLKRVQSMGVSVVEAESGELASGLIGQGRMSEPEHLLSYLKDFFQEKKKFAHKKVIITAGPTREAIDPVRYISNHSSGKMGYALAESLANQGAEVLLISGPVSLQPKHPAIHRISVNSAEEMYQATMEAFPQADIIICCAAVADYAPIAASEHKIKKKEDELNIALRKTPDILKRCGELKQAHQCLVGFALETQNALAYAHEKLQTKQADILVMNTTEDAGATFGSDNNRVYILRANQAEIVDSGLRSKMEIASFITRFLPHSIETNA